MRSIRTLIVFAALCHFTSGADAQTVVSEADFDGSGTVDFLDFVLFTEAFGESDPAFDLDDGGIVDLADFLIFVSVFGRSASSSTVLTTPAGTSHDMIVIPNGAFEMGSDDGEIDELPVHRVTLSTYHIDKFEVTNEQYLAFLKATDSTTDAEGNVLIALGNPDVMIRAIDTSFELADTLRAKHPVTDVTWYGAAAYCEWIGGRLPTEAEWEYAARGFDGRAYPWGNDDPTPDLVNYDFNVWGTTKVGSYPDGASPFGVMDLAGNVWEWILDWNDIRYYGTSPEEDPRGPESGDFRGIRGGAWGSGTGSGLRGVRSAMRGASQPWTASGNIGFRCAVEP